MTKKKEIGVSDLTLLSKVSNEAINDNLKTRFEHAEIYVCTPGVYLLRPVEEETNLCDFTRLILAMCLYL
jgi:hypothetical protein